MKQNMKILTLFSDESSDMYSLFCKNLIKGFVHSAINYRLVFAMGKNKQSAYNSLNIPNANRISTRISRIFGHSILRRDLIEKINTFSPTHIHVIDPNMTNVGANLVARFNIKAVFTYIGGPLQNPLAYTKASRIITFYEVHRETLVNRYGIPRENICIIPMGLDFESITKSVHRRNKKIVVGTNANLLQKREAEVFLNLVVSLSKERNDVKFLVSCDEEKEASFRRLAKNLGIESSLVFMATPKEATLFFNVIDIYVVPSESSDVLSSVIQSQSCGVPAICLSSKSLPLYEEVREGTTGFIIDGIDFFQFKEKITPLIDVAENLKNFKGHAFSFSRNRHALDKMMLQLQSIYSEI